MNAITSVPLDKLKIYGNWKQASVGTLLQARAVGTNATIVGLRCQMKVGAVPQSCFLVLDGADRGTLIEEGVLRDPALDVSDLLEIRVGELSPIAFSPEAHAGLFGLVCEHQAGSGHFLVRAKTRGAQRVFVSLSDPSGKEPVGTVITENVPDLLVVGLIEVSERASTGT